MSYTLVTGTCDLRVPSDAMIKFIDNESHCLKREQFAKAILEKTYQKYFHPLQGRFVGLKSIKIENIGCDSVKLNSIRLRCGYQGFFFKPYEKGIFDVIIRSVTSQGVLAEVLGYPVEIKSSDFYAGLTPEFDAANKTLKYPNQKEICVGDILRVRIQGMVSTPMGRGSNLSLKASCLYPGCGKRE